MNKRNVLFKDYLTLAYGCLDESWIEDKLKQFEHNYLKYLPNDKNSFMLDIGPGYGCMLLLWKRLGYKNYVSVDISPEVVEFCNRKGVGEVKLITDLSEFLEDKTEAFDFICMVEVIEHIEKNKIPEICSLMKKSLKPGGRVLVETPNMGAPSGSLLRYYDFTHEIGFTSHSLFQLLTSVGFSDTQVRGFDGIYRKNLWSMIKRFLRSHLIYFIIRKLRSINDSDLTDILSPYIYATAVK